MKRIKRTLSILLAVLLLAALTVTAFADDTGSIKILGAKKDKVYDVYKVFDLSYSGSGSNMAVSYTINPAWTSFFSATPGSNYILASQPSGGSLNQINVGGTIKYINITESNVAQFAQDALAYAASKTADKTVTPTADGDYTISGLPLGYYLVYPQGATEHGTTGSICSLTSTTPDAEVSVKATYPDITKTADKDTVEIGETITFTVSGKVPDTTGYTTYKYELKDTMSSGLTFNDAVDNITVKFGSTSITVPDSNLGTTYTIADNGFTLSFDMAKYQAYKGQDITVTYQAVVNDNAVVTLTENKASLKYSNDPSDSSKTDTTPDTSVQVYSSKIVIDKYDGADTTKAKKLKDAEFVLIKKDGGADTFYKYTAASGSNLAKVEWLPAGANGAVPTGATVVITDANGAASFAGLEDGTYYLRETKSPAGYNLLATDTAVTVTHTTTGTPAKPIGVSVTAQVANNAGTVLPTTGGIGTTIFYLVGGILVLASTVFIITRKRMGSEG